ncbi:hypothetical protein BH10ACT8_BH10ACT8_11150 [soil metagenome]
MTNHQQHLLTDEEKAWVDGIVARYPPFKPDQARRLAAMFLPKRTEPRKEAPSK